MSDLFLGSSPASRKQSLSAFELESIGKAASAAWSGGRYGDLTDAVASTIKLSSYILNAEQVKRVVEFANVDAYLSEFKKEGCHKIVDFGPSGPANPADVLRNLNAVGGATVRDSDLGDYSRLPEKRSECDGADIASLFPKTSSVGFPEENPYGDAIELRDKLASAYDLVTSQISTLETIYGDVADKLYGEVKQAALGGTSLGEVVQAWSGVSEDPVFVKAAFDFMVPRLFDELVFDTMDSVGESLMKTAGHKFVNTSHPVVQHYVDFCDALTKLAELRTVQDEYADGYDKISGFLSMLMQKEAAEPHPKSLVGALGAAAKWMGKKLGPGEGNVGLGKLPAYAISRGVAYGLPLYGAYAGGKLLKDTAEDYAGEYLPGTDKYKLHRMQQMGAF